MAVAQVRIRRKSFAASGFCLDTARMEPAAGRWRDQIGHIAADAFQLAFLAELRHCREQGLGIGMAWVGKQRFDIGDLA